MSFGKFAIGVSIGAALAPAFTSTIASSKEKIKGLADTVKKLETQRLAAAEVKKFHAQITSLEQRARSTGAASKGLRKEIIAAKEAFKAATVKARSLGVATRDITREEHRLETAIRRTDKALQSRRTMRKQRRFRREQAGGVLEAAAPVVAMAAPVVVAAKFEQGMAEVGAVAGASNAEMVQLTATARTLGATTSFSASEAAQGMKYLAMAGFKTTETIAAMPGVLALARAGNTDLARTADISSDMLSAFRLEADKMGMVGDVLTKTFTTSNVNLELLGETMKYVAPVATSAGMSIQEVAAMTGLLGDVGIKVSQAETALRASILRLADPPREAAEALEELGVSTVDSEGNLKKMPELLGEVAEAMEGMGSGERLSYVSQIFGMEASSAMDTLLEKTTGGAIKKKITLVADSKGATKEIAARMEATTMGAARRLRSAVESLGISFGSLALPVVNTLAGGLTRVAGGVDWIAKKFPGGAAAAFGLAAGFAAIPPVMLAMRIGASYLATAKAGLTLITSGLGRAFAWTQGQMIAHNVAQKATAVGTKILTVAQKGLAVGIRAVGAAARFAFGPVGIAVAALAAGAYLVYRHWDTVKGFLVTAWTTIKDGAVRAWEGVKKAFSWTPLGLVMQGFGAVKNFLSGIDLSASGAALITTFVSGIKAMAMAPIETVQGVLAKVREYLPFSDAKVGPLSTLTASGAAFLTTFTEGIKAVAMHPVEAVQGVLAKVREYLPFSDAKVGPLSSLTTSGAAFVTTFADGMDGGTKALAGKVSGVAAAAGIAMNPGAALADNGALEFPNAKGAAPGFAINYAPEIHVHGTEGSSQIRQNVEKALGLSHEQLRQMIADLMHDERRLSYA